MLHVAGYRLFPNGLLGTRLAVVTELAIVGHATKHICRGQVNIQYRRGRRSQVEGKGGGGTHSTNFAKKNKVLNRR